MRWYDCPKCGTPESAPNDVSLCGPCEGGLREETEKWEEEEGFECPECGTWNCKYDHDAAEYNPDTINRPDTWPSWITPEYAQAHHDDMMKRRAALGL